MPALYFMLFIPYYAKNYASIINAYICAFPMPIPVASFIFNDNQQDKHLVKLYGVAIFSHGQLYVAFSRAHRFADVSVQIVKSA